MAVIRLTESNLHFIKQELRKGLPGAKSSHLTEAIAAGFGYRTHAALLAHLEGSTLGAEPVVRITEDAWTSRLTQLDSGVPGAGRLVAVSRHASLPHPCWRELRRGSLDENDDWFRQCRAQNIPNVSFAVARKYAKLRWDCISLDPHFEQVIRRNDGRDMGQNLLATFRACASKDAGRSQYYGSAFVGEIDGVSPETARMVADEFFLLLYNASREWQSRYPDETPPFRVGALAKRVAENMRNEAA